MRLCFVGKYPPTEGGVARDNCWAAFVLAEQGTRSTSSPTREVEDQFRIFDEPWDPALPELYAGLPRPASAGAGQVPSRRSARRPGIVYCREVEASVG